MARGHYVMRAGQSSRPPGGAPFRARLSWAFFDWANQPFFTVITTFIFVPYFASTMVGDPVKGQVMWGDIQSIAGFTIAILSPFLGSIADAGGPRKPWIFFFQAVTIVGCILLFWAYPNDPDMLMLVAVGLVLGTIGAEFSIVFNNAQLPHLVPPERMGRLSGLGWGMGYLGGLVALFIVLIVSRPELIGITPPEGKALFGFDRTTYEIERWIGPASALWLVVFVTPMFLFVPDVPPSGLSKMQAARKGVASLIGTFKALRQHRNPLLFLIAYMIYNDGLAAIIAFGGVYAAGTFGWTTVSLGIFGIILTVFATVGAFVGGWLDDRFGSKPTVLVAILGVMVATLGIVSIGRDSILFSVSVAAPQPGGGLFASAPEMAFMGFALILGICMGPMQAASRTMIGRLAPKTMVGEFYGLFALSGRATTFLAPFLIARVTDASNSQRVGIMVVLAFLIVGFGLLLKVREEASAETAH
ncbi:MAG: MFS transporter [Reyranellaceae bacterium]